MRSFDPDNTVDQGGDYTTRNYIPFTHQAGDGKAVVVADTGWSDEDPVYLINGSRSPRVTLFLKNLSPLLNEMTCVASSWSLYVPTLWACSLEPLDWLVTVLSSIGSPVSPSPSSWSPSNETLP